MASALGELFGRVGLKALEKFEANADKRAQRRAERAERKRQRRKERMPEKVIVKLPDGTELERTEPLIPARTSTKVGVAGLAGVLPIIQGIQEIEFPWPWLESFTNSDLFVQIATIGALWLVARFSKTPAAGGAI